MPRTEAPAAWPTVGRVMLVGLPNTGKSTAWNRLTGRYNLVANYPLTTLEVRTATAAIAGGERTIVDTPGIHGLFVQSEEDAVVRRELLKDPPAVLVQCMDAHALKQSLALTADLAGLGLPLVVLVGSTVEANAQGTVVDLAGLERVLGCPVVEAPTPGRGIDALRDALARARPAVVPVQPRRPAGGGHRPDRGPAAGTDSLPTQGRRAAAAARRAHRRRPRGPGAAVGPRPGAGRGRRSRRRSAREPRAHRGGAPRPLGGRRGGPDGAAPARSEARLSRKRSAG